MTLRISGAPVTGEQYAVVVPIENGELLRAINATLEGMRRDGTLAELERTWLGPQASNPSRLLRLHHRAHPPLYRPRVALCHH